jgi:hypothetical protein
MRRCQAGKCHPMISTLRCRCRSSETSGNLPARALLRFGSTRALMFVLARHFEPSARLTCADSAKLRRVSDTPSCRDAAWMEYGHGGRVAGRRTSDELPLGQVNGQLVTIRSQTRKRIALTGVDCREMGPLSAKAFDRFQVVDISALLSSSTSARATTSVAWCRSSRRRFSSARCPLASASVRGPAPYRTVGTPAAL